MEESVEDLLGVFVWLMRDKTHSFQAWKTMIPQLEVLNLWKSCGIIGSLLYLSSETRGQKGERHGKRQRQPILSPGRR